MTHYSKWKVQPAASLVLILAAGALGLLGIRAAQDSSSDFAKRDVWQRPEDVMDELGIKPGSVVADVGCGSGYFTFRFAARVGAAGKVYAEDTDSEVLHKIRSRIAQEHLAQIETVQGTVDDPQLPADKLEVILVMNAYHEMRNYDHMLQGMYHALKPRGTLAIIDHEAEPGQKRSDYQDGHRIPEQLVRDDVARNGFQFLRKEAGFESTVSGKKYYFLIFEKPPTATNSK